MKNFVMIFFVVFASCTVNSNMEMDIRNIRIFENTDAWDLAQAVQKGNIRKIKRVVEENSNVLDYQEPRYGFTLLMWGIKMEKYREVKTLLELGANPNIRCNSGETALFHATEHSWLDNEAKKDAKYVKLLLQYGANPNIVYIGVEYKGVKKEGTTNVIDKGTSPLIHATSRSFEKAKALVEAGAEINYKTERNWTAANNALIMKGIDVAYYLIVEKKADVTEPYYFYFIASDSVNYEDERYPVALLRGWVFDLDSEEYKKKMAIVEEFMRQGCDYWATEPGKNTLRHIKKRYPNNWEEYLKKY